MESVISHCIMYFKNKFSDENKVTRCTHFFSLLRSDLQNWKLQRVGKRKIEQGNLGSTLVSRAAFDFVCKCRGILFHSHPSQPAFLASHFIDSFFLCSLLQREKEEENIYSFRAINFSYLNSFALHCANTETYKFLHSCLQRRRSLYLDLFGFNFATRKRVVV